MEAEGQVRMWQMQGNVHEAALVGRDLGSSGSAFSLPQNDAVDLSKPRPHPILCSVLVG